MVKDSKTDQERGSLLDKAIVAISFLAPATILILLKYYWGFTEVIQFISTSVGILTGGAVIWAAIWGAPKLIRASERQADEAAKAARFTRQIHHELEIISAEKFSTSESTTTAPKLEQDELLERIFASTIAFMNDNKAYSTGVSSSQFRSWKRERWFGSRDYQKYRIFMHQVVALFNLMHREIDGLTNEWRQKVWDKLDEHKEAVREWKEELGLDNFES